MSALRRAIYLGAALWAVAGLALAIAPKLVLVDVFDGPRRQEPAWLRLLGIQSFGLAMLMVLVAHRVEQLWWWSWAFALVATGTAAVATFHAAFGLRPHESSLPWWAFSAATLAFSGALLYGLFVSSREQPIP